MVPSVRSATSADVEAIGRIHVRGWQHGYLGLLPDTFLAGLDATERAAGWRARLSEPGVGRVLVAELAGQVAGFVAFGPSRDLEESESRAGEVYALYVEPDHWRAGAGKALMAAAVDELGRSGHPVRLWVLAGNERGLAFYARCGFRRDGGARTASHSGLALEEVRLLYDVPGKFRQKA